MAALEKEYRLDLKNLKNYAGSKRFYIADQLSRLSAHKGTMDLVRLFNIVGKIIKQIPRDEL